jgi:hypothetical protein
VFVRQKTGNYQIKQVGCEVLLNAQFRNMWKIIQLAIFLTTLPAFGQTLKTTFSDSWDRWEFDGATFKIVFSDDYGSWEYGSVRIRTTFSNDWDSWNINSSTTLKTTFSDDFERWEIRGNGKTVYVKTTFSDDFSRWEVSGDATGTMKTTFSDDYERWEIQVNFQQLPEDMQTAIIFVAVFNSVRLHELP